jgi:SAM-dependent methyltransferase
MELSEYRSRWKLKPVLRAIYGDYYKKIMDFCTPEATLEIGGGSGNLKEFMRDVVSLDIQSAPWLDVVADAQSLPFASQTFNNIVMVDVLHHIEYPVNFLSEAFRVLKDGGRLVALEPAITPLSNIFYRLFHDEPVDMCQDPYAEGVPDPAKNPFDANQAIPTLMFCGNRRRFEQRFPQWHIVETRYMSLLAYPLSGGFKSWSLMPAGLVRSVLHLENKLLPKVGRFLAFRLFVVLEKKIPSTNCGS